MPEKLIALFFFIVPFVGFGQVGIDSAFSRKEKTVQAKILENSNCGVMDTVLCFVKGKIIESNKAPLDLVDIEITNRSTKEMIFVESDSLGNFKIFIKPGKYDLRMLHSEYGEIWLKSIGLTSGQIQCIIVDLGSRYIVKEFIKIKAKEIRNE